MEKDKKYKDAITKRDVYERLWEGRNFEIEHLWQRSIFLATFLVLIFTAYLGLWSVFIGQKDTSINRISFSIGFIVLTVLGSIFSLLWIFMAKGSKYWYEKYETSISSMQDDYPEIFETEINREWDKEKIRAKLEHRAEKHIPIHGYLRIREHTNSSVFSLSGGPYSVSKINVSIGLLFYSFWIITQGFHVSYLPFMINKPYKHFISILIVLVINYFLILFLGNSTKSGEAGWYTIRKPFYDKCLILRKGIFRKKSEVDGIFEILKNDKCEKYKDVFELLNEKEYPPSSSGKSEKLTKKALKLKVKKFLNEKPDLFYRYLEEALLPTQFPSDMRCKWECGDRSLTFKLVENLKDDWTKQILPKLEKSSYSFLKDNAKTRVFSDLTIEKIKERFENGLSIDTYKSEMITFVLFDGSNSGDPLCYEEFWLKKTHDAKNKYSLQSLLTWLDSNDKQVFIWTISSSKSG